MAFIIWPFAAAAGFQYYSPPFQPPLPLAIQLFAASSVYIYIIIRLR